VHREVVFLHHHVRPQRVHQLPLAERSPRIHHQQLEQVEDLAGERDRSTFAQQLAFHSVELEWPKSVELLGAPAQGLAV
jgi:hypothetical protein